MRDQVRGPFAVVGNLPGQLDAEFVECRLKCGQVAARQRRLASAAPLAKQQHRVVGAHVPFDADAVEAVVDGAFSAAWAVVGRERRVGA